jgi:glycosyltransferase involved in cell wall biosynthesis
VTLLSDYEAHPIAVMEALAQGRRVLVAATAGLQELADRGLATALPLDSEPSAIADAIDLRLSEPETSIPVGLPTWDDCARQVLTIYRQAAG